MFKTLRDKLLGASKQAEEELDPQLNLDYESFRPEERDSGAVIRESHLDNVLWEMELALLQSDVAMEALEEMKEIIKKRLGFINFVVGGKTYTVKLNQASNKGISFEVPRKSLMVAVQNEIFDDLLLSNFMNKIRVIYRFFVFFLYCRNKDCFRIQFLQQQHSCWGNPVCFVKYFNYRNRCSFQIL
mgnify:CR=1 FL=1